MMSTRDLYEVLAVSRDATQDEIKAKYRSLARQHHPDVNPNDPTAEDKFKEIGQAYNILSDPDKRANYDRFGTVDDQPQDPFFSGSASVTDIFDMFFGGGMAGGGGRASSAQRGADLQARVQISMAEVITGAERQLEVKKLVACEECSGTGSEGGIAPETCRQCGGAGVVQRVQNTFIGQVRTQTACPVCGGTGAVIVNPCKKCRGRKQVSGGGKVSVKIPAGVESGSTLRVSGGGNEGVGGGRPGDLFVGILVEDDPRFERDGHDLHTAVEVSFAQAALGDEIVISGIDQDYSLDLPAGSQPNDVLDIGGAGLPPLHGGRRGKIHAHLRVKVPKSLSEEQKKLILGLAEAGGEPIPKGEKGSILGGLFKKKR